MTSGALPANPFVAAGMIEDPRLFVGRKDELHAIASRMQGVQPTSINIVGDKRIGKSSLLYHFFLTWEQRVQEPSRYIVIYLSLRKANCQTETGFYQEVANCWRSRVSKWQFPLNNPLNPRSWNRQTFSEAIRQWKQQQVLPVVCFDDFESLFDYPQEFNDGFYDNLRSLIEDNALMLVVASRKSLKVYGGEYRFVSSFFNIAHCISLAELTTDEAIQLTRLPTGSTHGAALSPDEQNYVQQWGQRHPYKLQLAGSCLWEARQTGKPIKWAKQQFDQQIDVPPSEKQQWKWRSWLYFIFVAVPKRLGNFTKLIGVTVDDVSSWIIGTAIVVMFVLVLMRVLDWSQVWDFVRDQLGISSDE
ncbi:AAA family ATPase [Nostoc minutum NIES-26]|uniref:AAA family ATPase n=1 Tax=Nostoc minutum NIES-26 TaxID=1844469 RepID=A0A367S1Z2_9NOSO|nr:AAA family ATPase [Nostoc minutum NIES-26]